MKTRLFSLFGCLVLTGCGGSAPPAPTDTKVEAAVDEPKLEPASEVSLKALLAEPRQELAAQAAILEKAIKDQYELRLEGNLLFALLPQTRLPSLPPIFREAQYSAERGCIVPPYVQGAKDAAVALHLARHGDAEAAQKFAEAGADFSKWALDRNYSAEWTRLVGLLLHHAQVSTASDNIDGAKQLVGLHTQLREVLSPAAQASPLGQVLLARGLETLRRASIAWKQRKQDGLAQTANDYLKKFGATQSWQWPLPQDRPALAAAFNLGAEGKAGVRVAAPLRVFDLLDLPAPHRRVESCWAFFGNDGKLGELLFLYERHLDDFRDSAQWVPHLVVRTETNPTVVASLTPGNPFVGGVLELKFGDVKSTPLPREFGPLSLDRSFEQNRRQLAWKDQGSAVTSKDARALAQVSSPAPVAVAEATLEREAAHDVVAACKLGHAVTGKDSLASLAASLFEQFGPAKIEVNKEVSLTWNDGQTRLRLALPQDAMSLVVLSASDASGQDPAKRLEAARSRDLALRQKRLAANQPWVRLPRALENLTLGMKRSDVERFLPGGTSAIRRELSDGLMGVYAGQPQVPSDAVLRGVFTRFDAAGTLAELRVRYADHPSSKPGTVHKKLDALVFAQGSGQTIAPPAALGADLTGYKPGVIHAWQDDLTLMTASGDGATVEITLRNCPPAHPDGEPLAPFSFLPRGPDKLSLGMPKDDVMALGGAPHEGAVLIRPKAPSTFDSVLAWFDGDSVSRIVARYRTLSAKEPAKVLPEGWGRELRVAGWPWRQEVQGALPQNWLTFDARTRYRLFWAEDNQGMSLYAEWVEVK